MRRIILAFALAILVGIGIGASVHAATVPVAHIDRVVTSEWTVRPAVETVVQEPQTASPDGKVVVNVGEWLDVFQEFLLSILTIVLTAVISMLPLPIRALILTYRVNQMAQQAARLGLSKAKEKLKEQLGPDGTITIPIKNEAAELGAEYAIAVASAAVSDFAGGKNGWKDKVLSRIEELLQSVLTEYKEHPDQGGKTA